MPVWRMPSLVVPAEPGPFATRDCCPQGCGRCAHSRECGRGALKQAEAAVALAERQVARTDVKSPLSGFVVKRFVNAGEQVDGTAAQPVVEVANLDTVELLVNVPALYLGKLRAGRTSDSEPGFISRQDICWPGGRHSRGG